MSKIRSRRNQELEEEDEHGRGQICRRKRESDSDPISCLYRQLKKKKTKRKNLIFFPSFLKQKKRNDPRLIEFLVFSSFPLAHSTLHWDLTQTLTRKCEMNALAVKLPAIVCLYLCYTLSFLFFSFPFFFWLLLFTEIDFLRPSDKPVWKTL